MNLLEETEKALACSGHTPEQIVFIGSVDSGHQCTWEQFRQLANAEYHNGFGAQKVAKDLRIVFSDGQQMWRGEYDGSEWWNFSEVFVAPKETKPIHNLFATPEQVGWCSLTACNEEGA